MKIVSYRQVNKGAVVGSFSLKIPEWKFIIHGMTLFQKDGMRWISMPSSKVEENGETNYYRHCYFTDKDYTERFNESVFKALEEYWKENQEPEQKNEEQVPF
jgi:DNA-binding cell septation regulator SpoVG